jgi:hypothetical protein
MHRQRLNELSPEERATNAKIKRLALLVGMATAFPIAYGLGAVLMLLLFQQQQNITPLLIMVDVIIAVWHLVYWLFYRPLQHVIEQVYGDLHRGHSLRTLKWWTLRASAPLAAYILVAGSTLVLLPWYPWQPFWLSPMLSLLLMLAILGAILRIVHKLKRAG